MKLDARTPKPVGADSSRDPFDLQLQSHYEKRGVYQCIEPASRGRGLGYSPGDVRRLYIRVDASGGIAAVTGNADRERACVVRAQPKTAHDTPLSQGIVQCVEKKITVL